MDLLTLILGQARDVGKCAIDNAFEIVHQLQRQLEGQAVAQRNYAANATTSDAVGKRVGELQATARHRGLARKEAAPLREIIEQYINIV